MDNNSDDTERLSRVCCTGLTYQPFSGVDILIVINSHSTWIRNLFYMGAGGGGDEEFRQACKFNDFVISSTQLIMLQSNETQSQVH